MGAMFLRQPGRAVWPTGLLLLGFLGFALLLLSCNNGEDIDSLPPPSVVTPLVEQQAIASLRDLYRTAILQEDSDRLQELLDADTLTPFLDTVRDIFRVLTVIDVQLTGVVIDTTSALTRISFQQVLSVQAPVVFEQRTRTLPTVWQLRQHTEPDSTVRILIAANTRGEGPEFLVTTRGQVQAGIPARVEVTEETGTFPLSGVEVEVPETGVVQALMTVGDTFYGFFTPPVQPAPQPLLVRLHGANGEDVVVRHRYRLRVAGEDVVQKIGGTGFAQFSAVAVAPDGTVWAGGTEPPFGGGTLYRVPPGSSTALFCCEFSPGDPTGQVEDLVFDALQRLHVVIRTPQVDGVFVLDQNIFCPTVTTSDPAYPFHVPDPATGESIPTPSTRAVAAGGGDIWLFGSDGGVARVADDFREGQCQAGAVGVRYDPVFRRQDSGLLSNVVPAFVAGVDETLVFGTVFGLTRLQEGQFTPVPFDPALSLQGDVSTLEAFFQAVAEAIFEARPVTTVSVGDVSFVEAFGSPLVKADIIFSAVADGQGRLWVGTLGEGIRRIESRDGTLRDTLHLTRQEGLGSNLISALAVAPDGTLWAATQEGASRIRDVDGSVDITNFSFLDGLTLGVRDVAVDAMGTPWLATDEGLFRIVPQGGQIQGAVRDPAGRPVVGADVLVLETPFRTVTDVTGRFVLTNLPPGPQRFQIDGSLAVGGPFTSVFRDVEVTVGVQTLEDVVLDFP